MESKYTVEYLGELELEKWDVIFTMKIPTKDEDGCVIDDIELCDILEDNMQLELNEEFDIITLHKICDNFEMLGEEDSKEPQTLWAIRMSAYMEKGTQYGWIKEILTYDTDLGYLCALSCIEMKIGEVNSKGRLKEGKEGLMI